MLTLPQLQTLAASYGADLARWPDADRDAALPLLRTSGAARTLLEREAVLDRLLSEAEAAEDAENWHEGEMDAAVARIRAEVGVRIRTGQTRAVPNASRFRLAVPGPLAAWLLLAPAGPFGFAGVTTGAGFAVATGLLVGWISVSQPASAGLLGLLQAGPFNALPF